jgi:hypothetical protein
MSDKPKTVEAGSLDRRKPTAPVFVGMTWVFIDGVLDTTARVRVIRIVDRLAGLAQHHRGGQTGSEAGASPPIGSHQSIFKPRTRDMRCH